MSVVYEVVLACALFSVPGYVLGLAAGLRGWLAVSAGPVLTLGVTAVCAAALRTVGLEWRLRTALVSWVVLVVVVGALAALARRRRDTSNGDAPAPPDPAATEIPAASGGSTAAVVTAAPVTVSRTVADHITLAVGALVVSVWGAQAITQATGSLAAVNQAWDSLFHAGAIRLIAVTGDTAPSALAAIGQPNNPEYYYPNLYHVLAALHLKITESGVTFTENATAAALPYLFVVATVGLVAVLGARTSVILFSAVLAVSVTAFPFAIIAYGALLPFAAAIATVPGMVALTEELLHRPRPAVAVMAALGGIGLLLTHPSVAVVAALWCGVHLLVGVTARGLGSRRLAVSLGVLAVVAGLGSLPVLGKLLAVGGVAASIDRNPFTGGASAAGDILFLSTIFGEPQWVASIVLFVGILVLAGNRMLWSAFAVAALMTVLYVLSAAYQSTLTSLWWDDPSRFASLFVPPAVLIAAFGAGELMATITRSGSRVWNRRPDGGWIPRVVTGVAAVALVALFGSFTSGLYQERHVESMELSFTDGPTLSVGEGRGMVFLKERYSGGTVMNDPQDGSPYGYSIFELPMVFKAPVTLPITPEAIGPDRLLLLDDFNELDTDPEVAAAVARLDIRWVMTGEGFLTPEQEREEGLTDLDDVRALEKVFDNGAAQVYRVLLPPNT